MGTSEDERHIEQWNNAEWLSPKEQAKFLQLLIERIDHDATQSTISVTYRDTGLRSLPQTQDHEETAA